MILGKSYLGSTEIEKMYFGSNIVYEVGGFTTEYQAILDEGTAQGYTLPSGADQTTQNDMIVASQASGVWDLSDKIFVFTQSGDADFKKIDWKNPIGNKAVETFNGTSGALVWSSTGITGDGINFLNLKYNPSSFSGNWVQDNAGFYVNIITPPTTFELAVSGFNTPNNCRIRCGTSAPQRINSVANTGINTTWIAQTGLLGVSRNVSTDMITSVDTTTTTAANTSAAILNSEMALFGYNTATAANYTRGDMEIGYAIMGADMSAKLADIKTAFD